MVRALRLGGVLRVTVLVLALTPSSAARPEPTVPALTGRVVDEAGILGGVEVAAVEQLLLVLDRSGRAQGAVLIARSLGGYEIEPYALAVVEKWQLGQKGKDNGFLIVVAPNERRMRLEVGYGLEGALTDAFSRQVLDGTLVPYFRERRYGDGLQVAIERIAAKLGADLKAPVQDRLGSGSSSRPLGGAEFWIILLFIIAAVIFRAMMGMPTRGYGMRSGSRGGWGSGGSFGGGFGGGGFRGGGGSFGGGGSSSRW